MNRFKEAVHSLGRRAAAVCALPAAKSENLKSFVLAKGYRLDDSDLGAVTLPEMAGLHVLNLGNGNILVAPRPILTNCALEFDSQASDNLIILGSDAMPPQLLWFQAKRNLCIIGGGSSWPNDLNVRFSSDGGRLLWGLGATSNGTSIILEGHNRSVLVGDDCMFAAGTAVRTSDLHLIEDEDGKPVNPSKDVRLDIHVWVGQDSLLSKGSDIGAGAIIGAKALVTGYIPERCIAAGVPAKVIREKVTWDRRRPPSL